MARKISALFTLAAFVLFSTSCMTWGMKEVRTLPQSLPENTAVLSVVMNSGQVIKFTKSQPGRIRGNAIVGTGMDSAAKQIDITGPFTFRSAADGTAIGVVDGEGRAYAARKILSRDENRMTILASELNEVSIPLSEIHSIEVKKTNAVLTTVVVIGGLAVAIFIYVIILINQDKM